MCHCLLSSSVRLSERRGREPAGGEHSPQTRLVCSHVVGASGAAPAIRLVACLTCCSPWSITGVSNVPRRFKTGRVLVESAGELSRGAGRSSTSTTTLRGGDFPIANAFVLRLNGAGRGGNSTSANRAVRTPRGASPIAHRAKHSAASQRRAHVPTDLPKYRTSQICGTTSLRSRIMVPR